MNIVDYPFIKAGEAKSRPALFIRLINPRTGVFQDTTGLIDSGASQCCVPAGYAEILGFDSSSSKKVKVRTATGTTNTCVHHCKINVWDTYAFFKNKKTIAFTVEEIPIYFIPTLTDVLLGVDFLNESILTLDYTHKVFSIRNP